MKMVPQIENKYANKPVVIIFLNRAAVLLLSFACVALFNVKNSNEHVNTSKSPRTKYLIMFIQKFINKLSSLSFPFISFRNNLKQAFTVIAFPFGRIQHVHHFPAINLSNKSLLSNDKF